MNEVGLILMIIGVIAFVVGLLYELVWAGERSRTYRYTRRSRYGPDEPGYY